jgi:hypothetical protein
VRHGEDDVTDDNDEDGEGEDIVDEGRAHAPGDREELEPPQDDTGGQHDHDGAADKNGIELLAGVELVDDPRCSAAEGPQPGDLIPRPPVDPSQVAAHASPPPAERRDHQRDGKYNAAPYVNINHERSPADDAGQPRKIQDQSRQHENAEEQCIDPMGGALHAVEPQDPRNGLLVRLDWDAHPAPPVNA